MREIKTVREMIVDNKKIQSRLHSGFNLGYTSYDCAKVYEQQQGKTICIKRYDRLNGSDVEKMIDDLSEYECLAIEERFSIYEGRVLHIVIKDNSREKRQIRLKKQLKKMFRKIV